MDTCKWDNPLPRKPCKTCSCGAWILQKTRQTGVVPQSVRLHKCELARRFTPADAVCITANKAHKNTWPTTFLAKKTNLAAIDIPAAENTGTNVCCNEMKQYNAWPAKLSKQQSASSCFSPLVLFDTRPPGDMFTKGVAQKFRSFEK